MRNSSLVEWFCAEDVTGLKHVTEAAVQHLLFNISRNIKKQIKIKTKIKYWIRT